MGELESSYNRTHEPNCKLALLQQLEEKRAANAAREDGAWNTGSNDPYRGVLAQMRLTVMLNEIRRRVTELRSGGDVAEADVDDLARYLQHKSAIERTHGIILADGAANGGEREKREDGSLVGWTHQELNAVDEALTLLPNFLFDYDARLYAITRANAGPGMALYHHDPGKKDDPDDDQGLIVYYDNKYSGKPEFEGEEPHTATSHLVHEVGHRVEHDPKYRTLYERFSHAAGWQRNVTDDQLQAAGFSPSQIADFRDPDQTKQALGFKLETGADGRLYQASPYKHDHGEVFARERGPLMTLYSGFHPSENFAEDFKYAVLYPEHYLRVRIDEPAAELAALQGPDPVSGEKVQRRSEAERQQKRSRVQYEVMRAIFAADRMTDEAAGRLENHGIDPGKLSEFRRKAERLFTPRQIRDLELKYSQ